MLKVDIWEKKVKYLDDRIKIDDRLAVATEEVTKFDDFATQKGK